MVAPPISLQYKAFPPTTWILFLLFGKSDLVIKEKFCRKQFIFQII
jgi:hypothetical protein